MKIDYNKIFKEAAKMGISPYTLIKHKINYRKAKKNENTCKVCAFLNYLEYKDSIKNILNCKIIGESIDKSAQIENDYTCDCWISINK
jgi:hypothetical protein